jgi:hypothetical protein
LLVVTSACAGGSSGPPDPARGVRLTASGGCGDAFLWATTAEGDVAVTVSTEARDRSAAGPTTIDFDLPDPEVTVEVLRGEDLARNFCNDVILPSSRPTDTRRATAGTGAMVLDPPKDPGSYDNCGTASGRLRLRGLVAEDGTTFAPIDARTDQIGCYAG